MAIKKPFRRTCRQFIDGKYSEGGRWKYTNHALYANSPGQYIRAFLLLQEDLKRLFQFIEPSDINLDTYSYRIHELLLRTCVEVEANCKAILKENRYKKSGNWYMNDYKKIEGSHFLSEYVIKFPFWNGKNDERKPFSAWSSSKSLTWHSAYNATKHDRLDEFHHATFENLTDAFAGLVALLSSQFWTNDYSYVDYIVASGGQTDGMESAIGGYFRVKFPDNIPLEKRYDFTWNDMKDEDDPFEDFQY